MGETERVPIRDAAQRLGVSPDTVRRHLKSGEMTGERQKTPQGFIWLVDVPRAPSGAEDAGELPQPAGRPELSEEQAILLERVAGLERLVSELQTDRDAWREQARRADDANRELRILVQQAQALTQALPAPQQETERETTMQPGAAPGPGLWQRLRKRLGG